MYNKFITFLIIIIFLKKPQIQSAFKENFYTTHLNEYFLYWYFEKRFTPNKISKKVRFKLLINNPVTRKFLFGNRAKLFFRNYLVETTQRPLLAYSGLFQIRLTNKFTRRFLSHFFKRWRRKNLLKKRILLKKKKIALLKKVRTFKRSSLQKLSPYFIKEYPKRLIFKKLRIIKFNKKPIKFPRSSRRLLWLWRYANVIGYRLKRARVNLRSTRRFYSIFSAKKLRKLLISTKFRKKKKRGRKGYVRYIKRIKNLKRRKRKLFFFKRGLFFKAKNQKNKKITKLPKQKQKFIPRKIAYVYSQKILKLLNKLKNLNNTLKLKTPNINIGQFYKNLYFKKIPYLTNIPYYFITFKQTGSNYYLTAINQKGEVVGSFSSGQVLLNASQRRNVKTRRAFFNIPSVVKVLSKRLLLKKIRKIRAFINPSFYQGWGTKKLVKQFRFNKVKIMNIIYESSPPHGLEKKKKKKRRL